MCVDALDLKGLIVLREEEREEGRRGGREVVVDVACTQSDLTGCSVRKEGETAGVEERVGLVLVLLDMGLGLRSEEFDWEVEILSKMNPYCFGTRGEGKGLELGLGPVETFVVADETRTFFFPRPPLPTSPTDPVFCLSSA